MISRRRRPSLLHDKQKLQKYIMFGAIGVVIFLFIFTMGVFAWFSRDLPSPGKLSQVDQNATIFYDRDGKVLFQMYKDKNRLPIAFKDISDYLKKGTISIEDKDFYRHGGISNTGILRSFFMLLITRKISGGGSTITQQLIKNVLLDSRQTPTRKLKEIILAISVEGKYTKDQILEMYLNEAPYGGSFYGVGSAAKGYFGKNPNQLSLLESAFIAGLPQSPSIYSPFIGIKDSWKGRTKDVLRRMREDGYITSTQEKDALSKINSLTFSQSRMSINAPHFVFYVKDLIEKEYGAKILDQGLKIKTTLSLDVQQKAEKIVKDEIDGIKKYKVGNGAVVVLDSQSDEILSMVGSYDYNDEEYGKYNAAVSRRQPGSAVKPITYALAFEKGYTPATMIMDVKTTFPVKDQPDYVPVNYDGKFRGPVQLRFSLANSYNIPAVKLVSMIGIPDFLERADLMGLHTLAPTQENLNRFGLSITLGGGEVSLLDLSNAFAVFARGGVRKEPVAILEIKDHSDKIIFTSRPSKETKVFSPEISFLISHILSDNNARADAFGLRSYLNIPGKTVAVKTGTTNDKKDNWAVGYTKGITVGAWVGNNDNTVMDPRVTSGSTGASPIWYTLMTELLKKYKDGIIDKPEKIKAIQIDPLFGGLPKDGSQTRSEYFIEGTEPKDISPYYKKVRISKANGKIANDIEIKTGNYEEKDCYVVAENDPVSTDGKNRWQEGIDNWRKDQSDDKWKCPTELSDNRSEDVMVSIKNISDHSTITDKTFTVRIKTVSMSPLKNIKIYLNNNEIKNYNEDKRDFEETISVNSDGVYELKVRSTNEKDKSGESMIKFGVNKAWDYAEPTTAPSPTSSTPPTATPTST
ncbi:MAG: transglycosylase domain-containing protein [bacterium]